MTREQVRRVLGYIRVSTDDQAESGAGLEAQREAIRQYAIRRGWELVAVLEDCASGKSMNGRHELERALRDLKAHAADGLVVSKLDRLGRSISDLVRLADLSRKHGWALVALDVDFDTSTPTGEAMFNMMAVFAQWERRLIGQRTKEALAVKKAQGVILGRRRTLPDDVRQQASRLRAEGWSYQRIGAELGLGWTTIRQLTRQAAP